MQIKEFIDKYNKLNEELELKKICSELLFDKICSLANKKIRSTCGIYIDVIKNENDLKEYLKIKEIKNIEFSDEEFYKHKIINFNYKNKKYQMRIPYQVPNDVKIEDILSERYNKIQLRCITNCLNKLIIETNDIVEIFKYLKKE